MEGLVVLDIGVRVEGVEGLRFSVQSSGRRLQGKENMLIWLSFESNTYTYSLQILLQLHKTALYKQGILCTLKDCTLGFGSLSPKP